METRLLTAEHVEKEIEKALEELEQMKTAVEERVLHAKDSVDAVLIHFDEYSGVVKGLPMEDNLKNVIMSKQRECRAKMLREYEILDRKLAAITGASQVLAQVQSAARAKEEALQEEEAAKQIAQDRVEKIEQRIAEEGFDPTARRSVGERPESLKHIRNSQWKIKEKEEQEE